MQSRRRLLRTGAATLAAAMIARMPRAFAATCDLIIRGGRVIDPSLGLDAPRDVAIAKGKIAAVGEKVAGDAAETIDAGGKLVVPGLIDIHTHAGRSKEGPGMLLQDGVTGWVDAGSGTMAELQHHVALEDVDAIVLSHDHADHWTDIEGFYVAYRYRLNRTGLPVYAPPGLREKMTVDTEDTFAWHQLSDGARLPVAGMTFAFSRSWRCPTSADRPARWRLSRTRIFQSRRRSGRQDAAPLRPVALQI